MIDPKQKASDMRRSPDDDPALEHAFMLKRIGEFYPLPISKPSVWRWAKVGCRGVILKTVRIGGYRVCTVDWLNDFLEQINATSRDVTARAPSSRSRAQRAADARLDRAGI